MVLLLTIGVPSGCRGPEDKNTLRGPDSTETDVPDTPTTQTDTDTDTDTDSAPAVEASTDLCVDPEPILDPTTGVNSGFVQCADGAINRVFAVATVPAYSGSACRGDEDSLGCTTDADCSDDVHGFCAHQDYPPSDETGCGCEYSCATDEECGASYVCIPQAIAPRVYATRCVPAECATNAGCASTECGLSAYNDGCDTTVRLECRDDRVDACRADDDCDDQCAVSDDHTAYECRTTTCDIGRPPVDSRTGKFVLAAPASRSDWSDTVGLHLPESPADRLRLAAHWTEVARLEHASVAAFARFSLDLLALGAPAKLLAAAHAAAADEIEHARFAFSIASATGASVGPGPLRLRPRPATRATVLFDLIREACVGETCGVLEARAAVEACTEPTIRASLQRVASDESRHAVLAWKTLSWLLEGADAPLRAQARAVFEETIGRATHDLLAGPEGLSAWGVLEPKDRAKVRRHAIAAVVRPCMEAALAPQCGATTASSQGTSTAGRTGGRPPDHCCVAAD